MRVCEQEWKNVQSRMRVQGREGVFHRISQFQPDTVNGESLLTAQQLLNTCSVDEIRAISAACAALYDWASVCYKYLQISPMH